MADTVQIAMTTIDNGDGTFTDTRDAKTYRMVRIGNLTWMAENLNFATDSSVCYKNVDSNCTKYGRLYNWNDAMTACPASWRLPDTADWNSLTDVIRSQRVKGEAGSDFWLGAGDRLKSKTGWAIRVCVRGIGGTIEPCTGGTDEFGFSALPGGLGDIGTAGEFRNILYEGYWWSASENDSGYVLNRWMHQRGNHVWERYGDKSYKLSVRCLQDFAAPQ